MELTKFDVTVLITMTMAIVGMSFVFPALGLSNENVEESDIPEFNITPDRFNWAGEFPDRPGNPTQGTLVYIDNAEPEEDNRQIWLQRKPTGDDYVLSLTNLNGTLANPVPTWTLTQFNESGSVEATDMDEVNESEFGSLEAGEFVVTVQNVEVENAGMANLTIRGDWQVKESPTVGGGITGTIATLGSVVGWIGTVIWWISATAVTTVLNVIGIAFDTVSFFAALIVWLTTTYAGVVSSVSAPWASIIVAIPGILLSLVFAKVAMVIISILPFT